MESEDKKVLFFVMGIQRSGGSTILDSFHRNRKVTILREKDKSVFDYFMLQPESEIRPILKKSKPITFIEAKSETKRREVTDVFSEFSGYSVKIIWNYRNPVNVFYSRLTKYPHKDWVSDELQFCEMWNQRNESVLKVLEHRPEDIAVVKLEDLIRSNRVFKQLCRFIGEKGRYKFYPEKSKSYPYFSDTAADTIIRHTSGILNRLDKSRRFVPDES